MTESKAINIIEAANIKGAKPGFIQVEIPAIMIRATSNEKITPKGKYCTGRMSRTMGNGGTMDHSPNSIHLM